MASATIIVVPRERFSYSQRSLENILANTDQPFSMVYVDGGSPAHVRQYLERAAAERGFRLIQREHYLSPNQARNLGAEDVGTDYVVFIDNDAMVEPGWLQKLLACAEETGAWIVGPVYCIGELAEKLIHMAGGDAAIVEEGGKRLFREAHRYGGRRLPDVATELRRGPTELVEFHCMLLRTSALRQLGPLDEGFLCSREHIDLCLLARAAGGKVFFEPASVVSYVPPPPFALSDIPYYLLRWSDEWGFATMRHFHQKWRLDNLDDELIDVWIRTHRRLLFARARAISARFLGKHLGKLVIGVVAAIVEAAVTPFARRRGARSFPTTRVSVSLDN